jgi:hypothetical protein
MNKIVLTGVVILLAAPAYAAEVLPDAMMGDWGMDGEGGEGLARSAEGGDFHLERDTVSGVDSECKILKVEKLADNKYTVQTNCHYPDNPANNDPYTIETDEFELKGNRLFITPVGS